MSYALSRSLACSHQCPQLCSRASGIRHIENRFRSQHQGPCAGHQIVRKRKHVRHEAGVHVRRGLTGKSVFLVWLVQNRTNRVFNSNRSVIRGSNVLSKAR